MRESAARSLQETGKDWADRFLDAGQLQKRQASGIRPVESGR